jgi:hypothetical protein
MAGDAQALERKDDRSMLNVACVKWGDAYGPEYVNRLCVMLERHLHVPFDFHCFTDDRKGIGWGHVHHLPRDLDGWWNKLWLFSPGVLRPGSRVLYFDLDTVIVGDISALARCDSDFAALRDFYRPRGVGSGVMAWQAGAVDDFWTRWNEEDRPTFSGGDQAWIEIMMHRKWGHHILPHRVLQHVCPGMFASYKADCFDGPGDARIICFHGQPKPHNCGADWIMRAWTEQPSRIAAE